MTTTATAEEIAEARELVERLQLDVLTVRYELVRAAEADDASEIDRLAARLVEAKRECRITSNVLDEMVAGAGDFHVRDEDR